MVTGGQRLIPTEKEGCSDGSSRRKYRVLSSHKAFEMPVECSGGYTALGHLLQD